MSLMWINTLGYSFQVIGIRKINLIVFFESQCNYLYRTRMRQIMVNAEVFFSAT